MSKQATHTPGPWKVIEPQHGSPTEYLCVELDAETGYTTLEMLPADAYLMAASPDLLAAVEALLALVETCASCKGSGLSPRYTEDACEWCGGVGEQLRANGEIGTLRTAAAKARGTEEGD